MVTSKDKMMAEVYGTQAFKEGKSEDANPYHRRSVKNGGVLLAAWWNRGWKMAKTDATEKAETEARLMPKSKPTCA